ncbi:hypothetical protein V5F77_23150 [Xanthobacter sp. DSM 24535]|jgi:hypothetical protein|uniref:Uncharacterized protein n=1 Tax=Aquabacter spiritensis TaxID=933073 RepID=A0A4R3LN81_9HYPH|nr:hypothetical protein [Aquabacter spiritensis]TCT01893.1 hypothetical protein EDC64_11692 [Aquabacter spiritensis]
MAIRQIILATTLVALSTAPALSDPYSSRLSQKEKARHEFRDVQRSAIPVRRLCSDVAAPHGATDVSPAGATGRRPTINP